MATAQDVLEVARAYIGLQEHPPGSNRQMFGEWYGWNGVAWCAMFVSYCFYRARLPLQVKNYGNGGKVNPKGFAYCPYGVRWFREAGRLLETPQVGDVVFFDWDDDATSDHVGIVERVAPGAITTIEGNTSFASDSNGGQVMRRERALSATCGFGRPSYNGTAAGVVLAPAWPGRFIKLTSPLQRGADVRLWQQRMLELGYDLGRDGADGRFGEDSHAALLKFQRDHALVADGVLGSITWAATWS